MKRIKAWIFFLMKKYAPKKYKKKIKNWAKSNGLYDYFRNIPENDIIAASLKTQTNINKNLSKKNLNEITKLIEYDVDEAKIKLSALWVKFPWDKSVILSYCDYYCALGLFEDAIRLLDKSIGREKHWLLYYRRALILRQAGKLSSALFEDFKLALILSNFDKKVLIALIKAKWAIEGISPDLIKYCDLLYKNKAELNATEFVLLAAIDCDAGRLLLSVRKIKEALAKDNNICQKYQSIPVMSLLYNLYPDTYPDFILQDNFYKYLNKNSTKFIELIKNAGENFAIVGNGPSEINEGHGQVIDRKKVVVRFNAYDTSYPLSKDYGTKTDVWVKAGNYVDLPRRNIRDFCCIVASGFNNIYRSTMGMDDYYDAYQNDISISIIPNYVYEQLICRLKAMPSAGLALLYWLYKETGPIPRNCIYGFSFGDQPKNKNQHYFQNTKAKVHYIHDWTAEGIILKEIVKQQTASKLT